MHFLPTLLLPDRKWVIAAGSLCRSSHIRLYSTVYRNKYDDYFRNVIRLRLHESVFVYLNVRNVRVYSTVYLSIQNSSSIIIHLCVKRSFAQKKRDPLYFVKMIAHRRLCIKSFD